MYPHRIRLRGPWESEAVGRPPIVVRFPTTWDVLVRGCAEVLVRRRFGYPGRLDASERVWIVAEGLCGPLAVRLNDRELGGCTEVDRFAVEITGMLGLRNNLEMRLGPSDRAEVGPLEVCLEIRAAAWLEVVALRRDEAGTWVEGRVVGDCPEPLELYALAERSSCGYLATTASAVGVPFRMAVEGDPTRVRVELIRVSSVWWTEEAKL